MHHQGILDMFSKDSIYFIGLPPKELRKAILETNKFSSKLQHHFLTKCFEISNLKLFGLICFNSAKAQTSDALAFQ